MKIAFPFFLTVLGFLAMASNDPAPAQDFQFDKHNQSFFAPPTPQDAPAWLAALKKWREENKAKIKYDGAEYARPEFAWCQRNFVQPQMMVEDRYFYDPATRKYTVDKYLDDLDARYGRIDSVLMWPVYPNVGIDNRNQHDLLRDLPGGLEGVKAMIADFHKRGVHVLFPMMPWEAGAREEGVPLKNAVTRDFAKAGIDGVNGDTMDHISKEFVEAADATGHPLAFQPECGAVPIENVQWDVMTWGYWARAELPTVSKYKWLESRHMVNLCERWAKERIDGLQLAFFNGCGYESWENIWGIWNGYTPRAAEAQRRVATIQRALAEYLVSPDWEPYTAISGEGVYASKFPLGDNTLWLIVNRSDKRIDATVSVAQDKGLKLYDVWGGTEPTTLIFRPGTLLAVVPIEAHGFGAILATKGKEPANLTGLLKRMAELSAKPLSSYSNEWKVLTQEIVPTLPTAPASSTPEGMVAIPAAKYYFKVHGVEIESWDIPATKLDTIGVDVQYPWESEPIRGHEQDVDIKSFAMDKYPVTNADFKKFLDATKYHPEDDHNFLKDWKDGNYPDGWAKKPVTWVSLEDARAYAKWTGKRLPHEWEWQYAAQGTDGRPYPWGTLADADAIPKPESGHDLRGPTDVDAYPKGASPFGVMDMTGNVWQWTDEYQDEHTRAAIVRGGSYYRPGGSMWYFPQNTTLDQHGKYLLMCPGKDRAGTLGFRCVKDM